ncbi:MAG: hypothetical protein WD691_03250 [Acidimicrobiales bacterium]
MELRVLVLTEDAQLGELVKAQVDNLGCTCNLVTSYDGAASRVEWADGAVIDLVGEGLDDLRRLRVAAPSLPVLAIAPDIAIGAGARSAGVQQVLIEPFSIADIVDGVRALAAQESRTIIDLDEQARSDLVPDDKPWWATR